MKCSICHSEIIETLSLIEWFITPTVLCFRCQKKFHRLNKAKTCPGCGRENTGELCQDCQQWQESQGYTLKNTALFSYNEGFQEWIEAYKFKGDYRLRSVIARELKKEIRKYPDYLISPIPLSNERFAQRGFNQVIGCLEVTGKSYNCLLQRKIDGQPQSMKSRVERLKMPQPYKLKVDDSKIRGRKVLLIDDVYTTGRTLFHAAEILYEKGAETVKSLTFAR
ncbi:ComF family protein [Enterococcus sp. AZ109]|uniref:ComF family protein n=1 Tax=Enterococcus sp. AZ109 TaxID=2774634 RepID=UPI003F2789AF